MKTLLVTAIFAATALTPAFADEHDWHGGGGYHGGSAPQARAPAPPPTAAGGRQAWGGFNDGAPRAPQMPQGGAPQYGWNRGGNGAPQGRPAFAPQANTPQFAPPQQNFRDFRQGQPGSRAPNIPNDGRFAQNGGVRYGYDQNQGQWNRGDANRGWTHDGDHGWHRDGDNRGWHGDGHWDRDWRRDRRYDWQAYRNYNRDISHIGVYYNPFGYGYYYEPFAIGAYLDAAFYSSSYWIEDPYAYRLPPTDGNTRWVRYYNDVLLIDIDTGEVIDVIHNFFW